MDETEPRWIVARSKPNRELYARDNIERQGYECYVPRFAEAITGRVKVLFPGYLFVFSHNGQWIFLQSTYGILTVVRASLSPASVPLSEIEYLKDRETRTGLIFLPQERFVKGNVVRIKHGPFVNFTGLYDGMSTKNRVNILLDVLGKQNRVQIEERYLEAV